jgi:antitoxin component HigA of HigAB toxin-antitoxin module
VFAAYSAIRLLFVEARYELFGCDRLVMRESVVSLILRGERELNVRQIRALAKRFKVSPQVFL